MTDSNTCPGMTDAGIWRSIILAFVVSLVVMIACAYLWVFIYSQWIYSGGSPAFYAEYAAVASPVVAVVVACPVFFCVGRYMRRFGRVARNAAMAVVAINLAVDIALVISMVAGAGETPVQFVLMSGFAGLGKLLGAYAGSQPG